MNSITLSIETGIKANRLIPTLRKVKHPNDTKQEKVVRSVEPYKRESKIRVEKLDQFYENDAE